MAAAAPGARPNRSVNERLRRFDHELDPSRESVGLPFVEHRRRSAETYRRLTECDLNGDARSNRDGRREAAPGADAAQSRERGRLHVEPSSTWQSELSAWHRCPEHLELRARIVQAVAEHTQEHAGKPFRTGRRRIFLRGLALHVDASFNRRQFGSRESRRGAFFG